MADIIKTENDLKQAIADAITPGICSDIIDIAYSNDNKFADSVFIESDIFFDDVLGNTAPFDIAKSFYDGTDLDADEDHANPNSEYFRLTRKDTVESTDYPEDIYYDELFDDIVDYIMDHLEDYTFPEDVQDVIDEYLKK